MWTGVYSGTEVTRTARCSCMALAARCLPLCSVPPAKQAWQSSECWMRPQSLTGATPRVSPILTCQPGGCNSRGEHGFCTVSPWNIVAEWSHLSALCNWWVVGLCIHCGSLRSQPCNLPKAVGWPLAPYRSTRRFREQTATTATTAPSKPEDSSPAYGQTRGETTEVEDGPASPGRRWRSR